jgi:membrane-anchored glycerophosphoryl diester phosphodiesterase (GDPDase)
LIFWSFYIIYITRLDRLFLVHPVIGSIKLTTKHIKELLSGPYGSLVLGTVIFIILEILIYLIYG